MKDWFLIKHLTGLLIFTTILFVFMLVDASNIKPYVASKLPMRRVVEAKRDLKVYQCENFGARIEIGVLRAGEIADIEAYRCGVDTNYIIKLSDGTKGCYSANDDDKAEQKTLKFYYF